MQDLQAIFAALKPLLQRYHPPFVPKHDDERYYDLWAIKEVVFAGRKRKEVCFAGLIIQKSYVGFYYMPIYARPELKQVLRPELLALLKGKSCFYIRKADPVILAQIEDALKIGFEMYKEWGLASGGR
jgi:hypothetical protein